MSLGPYRETEIDAVDLTEKIKLLEQENERLKSHLDNLTEKFNDVIQSLILVKSAAMDAYNQLDQEAGAFAGGRRTRAYLDTKLPNWMHRDINYWTAQWEWGTWLTDYGKDRHQVCNGVRKHSEKKKWWNNWPIIPRWFSGKEEG